MKNISREGVVKPSNRDLIRILCVEHNPNFLKTLRMGLEQRGFTVVTASQGLEAVTIFEARSGKFGAVVVGHDTPQIRGLEFVHLIRQKGFKRPIFLTAENLSADDSEAYFRFGLSAMFQKPFEINTFAALIELSLLVSLVPHRD